MMICGGIISERGDGEIYESTGVIATHDLLYETWVMNSIIGNGRQVPG
jgi:hypothetical protein